MNNLSAWIGLVGSILGLFSFISGGVLWYKGSIEKKYAAERDFNHLRKNQEQMGIALGNIFDEVEAIAKDTASSRDYVKEIDRSLDEMNRTFVEQKAFIVGISNRLEGLASRSLDGVSQGWARNFPPRAD